MSYTLVPSELIVDGAITSAKLDTNISISGTLGVTGEVTLATHLNMGDNDKIKIGTGGDLEIYHDGSNSYIANSTGNIYIADTNGAVHIQAKLNEESIVASADGAVTLYHDNSAKLATASGGVTVTGTLTATTLAGTLSTAAQTNITSVGTLTGFRSTGIDDNADATAITIDSSENVGIGLTNQANKLQVDGDICIGKATTSADLKSTLKMRGANGSNELQVFDLVNDGENGRVDFKFNRAGGSAQTIMTFGATVGNVGIGDTSPHSFGTNQSGLTISDGTGGCIRLKNDAGSVNFDIENGGGAGIKLNSVDAFPLIFATSNTERMRIDSSGNVGIGQTSPSAKLDVNLTGSGDAVKITGNSITDFDFVGNPPEFNLEDTGSTSGQRRARITLNDQQLTIQGLSDDDSALTHNFIACDLSAGDVTVGSSSAGFHFDVSTQLFSTTFGTGGNLTLACTNSSGSGNGGEIFLGGSTRGDSLRNCIVFRRGSGTQSMLIDASGNVTIAGSLSKGSGSFKIDHPIESKKDTHYLVHSFVEAPQADNIYRGVVVLENGTATINLDIVSGMSEGTFVLLNTNISCFTSNETDWDSVKGSVSGNILTISCQNTSSTATVSWLVIGERHDQHMLDNDWTDDNGKVIVEPSK